jgi:hypothetical protein
MGMLRTDLVWLSIGATGALVDSVMKFNVP